MRTTRFFFVALFTYLFGLSSANADSSLWYQFACFRSGVSPTYSMQMNSELTTTTIFESSYQLCDKVCVYIQDKDGDATDETDGFYDISLRRYSGDLDSDSGSWSQLSNYSDPDDIDFVSDSDFTSYCWEDWSDGYSLVYYNSTTEEVRKTVFFFTDEGDIVRQFAVVSYMTFNDMWP
ncbi:MAG: hypothetical protein M0R80_28235 [Proteobacteria bacterium]|jgi:hypothetical protein|nr:hypothetical protein [Pseudomonadota bacterium]